MIFLYFFFFFFWERKETRWLEFHSTLSSLLVYIISVEEELKSLWAYKYWQSRPPPIIFLLNVIDQIFIFDPFQTATLTPSSLVHWLISFFLSHLKKNQKICSFQFFFFSVPFFTLPERWNFPHTHPHSIKTPSLHTPHGRLMGVFLLFWMWVGGCVCVCATSLIKKEKEKKKRQKSSATQQQQLHPNSATPKHNTQREKKREVVHTVCCVCVYPGGSFCL